ncbi:nucleotidyltransferase family protein [Roseovarius salis]|uniref:nucleotidyltransferase family protein n=1 Tax=Roseovarius salis TaxID=3376063 RepID=UPI0037C6618F
MPELAILVPAAGSASRMGGRDKLLEQVGKEPLLRRQARLALSAHVPVLLTLPRDRPDRLAALAGLHGLDIRRIEDAAEGMATSLRAGAEWASSLGASGLMVVLGDMPELRAEDLAKVMQAHHGQPERAWRATDDTGRAGHPVILPARLFEQIARLRGDDGARALLATEDCGHVPLPGRRATTDLDTPRQWAEWRAGRTP